MNEVDLFKWELPVPGPGEPQVVQPGESKHDQYQHQNAVCIQASPMRRVASSPPP